jgi:predicted nucleic acid-binding protein
VTLLVDSDIIIDWLAGGLSQRFPRYIGQEPIALSAVSATEVLEGFRHHDPSVLDRWAEFLSLATLYAFDLESASVAADIRKDLRLRRRQVDHRAVDILIAATAVQYDLTLVTRNTRHFEDIEGLRIWSGGNPPGESGISTT